MSENLLRLIPVEPTFVPDEQARLLRPVLLGDGTVITVSDNVDYTGVFRAMVSRSGQETIKAIQ